jgi:hypothetical protein
MTVGVACRSCGTGLRESTKFCGECGAPTAGSGDAAQYKQVTAIEVMRQAVDELRHAENLFYGVWGTGVLVQTLLERGAEGDLTEAQQEIDRLANLPAADGSAMRKIWLLRLRALLAGARGDDAAYRDLASRYRAMAESLGVEGHIDWADAMIAGT